ncbi:MULTISPECIES: DnaB-like helicase N-terminal domain-containing protein [Streptomyces]|nr:MULTISPECIES: DnaB-like helicase N-terminal domain-containing protein [Streptomyces]MBC2879796.1 AAA family ATPase [Streptomyces sp. TYQ1024]UBI41402.1 AAA family ATPase [Streptomyces mobaraensis]
MPPQNTEAEQAVLGAMLLSRDAIVDVIEVVTGSDFYRPAHEAIFDTVCSMAVRGEPCDPITVTAELKKRGDLERVGGPAYLHELVQAVPTAAHAEQYARNVRDLALLRGVIAAGTRAVAAGYAADGVPQEIAERAVEDMRAARDRGLAVTDAPPVDLVDFLAQADDEPEWVIPGVLARWDRLMITAGEGGGKSLLIRQIAMRAAAGLHPWKRARIRPVRVLLVDVENSAAQARPWLRKMAQAAAEEGAPIGSGQVAVEIPDRSVDLTNPADRSWLARRVERVRPDLITIGPLYKLALGNPNEEETARAVMSALEMLRTASGGAAMLIEAHSPHAAPGVKRRDLRPIGSSLWLRWPEFGFGLSPAADVGAEEQRLMDWLPWRGARSERTWPEQLCQGVTWPWQAVQYAGNGPIPGAAATIPAQPEHDEWLAESLS